MALYAIGDMHLSLSTNKPMDIFGSRWENHTEKLRRAFSALTEEDTTVICGDLSWGMDLSEAREDFLFIDRLPGKKIILKGNHDYWWSAIGRVRSALPEGMRALQNDSIVEGSVGICGTRGWLCPGSSNFSVEDQKIYLRELDRLSLSLGALKGQQTQTKIAMMHFPPFCDRERASGFSERLEQSGVNIVVYGHLHGEANKYAFEGEKNGILYYCVAADKLDFMPKRIV